MPFGIQTKNCRKNRKGENAKNRNPNEFDACTSKTMQIQSKQMVMNMQEQININEREEAPESAENTKKLIIPGQIRISEKLKKNLHKITFLS